MFEYYLRKITWLSGTDHGWGNGYVKIPKGHWLYGLSYDTVNEWVDVHYGLTYAAKEEGCWVFGFDTAHYKDTLSKWPKEAVENETIRLSQQLFNLKQPERKEETLNDFEHCEGCGQVQGKCTC